MAALAICLLLLLPAGGSAQSMMRPERNPAGLLPGYLLDEPPPPLLDTITNTLFPPAIIAADAAVAIRHALMLAVVGFNIHAAGCDPARVALDFWGERHQFEDDVCTGFASRAEAIAYSSLRALELEFPAVAAGLAIQMAANGYDPKDRSTNMSTGIGVGNAVGMKVAKFFAADGWNSLGDLTREHYRQPFEDTSGYRPVNCPWEVEYPLRWQPLTQHVGNGRYIVQSHVVPFAGDMDPLVLSPQQFLTRQAPPPYADINAKNLTNEDAATMNALVGDLFETSANLTFEQRFQARWFEFKSLSLGFFVLDHGREFGWKLDQIAIYTRWFLGEMLAQHDAILLAWKEKVRHDAVRPETVIGTMYKGQRFRAWVDAATGAAEIAAEEWEPLIPTQPHSEYPSGSAAICNASAQHADLLLKELRGEVRPIAKINLPPGAFGPAVDFEGRAVSLEYETYEDVSRACGMSRLWAGVHFGPSVPAGWALADGVGRAAYEHVRALLNGQMPEYCARCTT
ncbi:unnamed protein product [Ostreobium quekettii]|uniref:Uncharacterized protein n=1 Tax=Ostreobium quekettii TaxID=121088 RepID=A0A8S1IZL5_9CHLO|nr:unnamed protein product [Ostreobium quekettii]|eukprot:evm.model.scf_580EXC.1 EVM.evm.TU.scf_580EXC.1   scf_580EXC:8880-10415(+)